MFERFAGLTFVNVSLGCLDLCSGVQEILITVLLVIAKREKTKVAGSLIKDEVEMYLSICKPSKLYD